MSIDTSDAGDGAHRVVILGGGMGGLAAAWRLANDERQKFLITIYQRDHLLGGKGASSRSEAAGYGQRIEEHGIHILMGWYDEAIGLLREVYESLESFTDPALGSPLSFKEILRPHDTASMAESPALLGRDDWDFWTVKFPQRTGKPGERTGRDRTVPLLIQIATRWLGYLRGNLLRELHGASYQIEDFLGFSFDAGQTAAQLALEDGTLDAAHAELFIAELRAGGAIEVLDVDMETIASAYLTKAAPDPTVRQRLQRLLIGVWLAKAMVRGLLHEGVQRRDDFERFDDMEFRAWLRKHGGAESLRKELTWDSPPVQILYDLAFGRDRDFAAGVWAYALLLFAFGYKGSYVYKMNGGMGDIVFAPLYLALKQKNVEFRFLHEVTRIEVRDDVVSAITLVDHGSLSTDYQPLIGVKGTAGHTIPCWPARPTTPPQPAADELTLREGQNYDSVVLAIGVAGLLPACAPLADVSPRFRRMLDTAGTVATQAAQLWLHRTAEQIGWEADALVASYVRPFNSCVEMNQVLEWEPWPAPHRPTHCIYLCDQAPEGTGGDDVYASLVSFLKTSASDLMPDFAFDDLVDPKGRTGSDRVRAQYWRANAVGSDRYVITPPGSTVHRLPAGFGEFRNLALAGDWVETEINAGCLEAATMAGLAAADAICAKLPDQRARYVDTPVDWVRSPPYEFRQARMLVVPLPAARGPLRRLCLDIVGQTAGISVTPMFDGLIMVLATIEEARSRPERRDGFLEERECVFFVPVRVGTAPGTVALLAPVAFVDNPAAVVAGREIYGFPKFPAHAVRIGSQPLTATVEVLSLAAPGPASKATPRRVVELAAGPALSSAPLSPAVGPALTAVTHALNRELAGTSAAAGWNRAHSPTMPLVFLRQLRDAASPAHAAFQQVVSAPATVDAFHGGYLHRGPFQVSIPRLYRPDLQSYLGLDPSPRVSLVAELNLDFSLGLAATTR